MGESREEKLAKLLVNYSVNLKEGEVCLINAVDVPCSMVEKLIKAVVDAKAIPLLNQSTIRAERALIEYSSSKFKIVALTPLIEWLKLMLYRYLQL